MISIQDWMDKDTRHVMTSDGTKALGYIRQFGPREWKAYDSEGKFVGWYTGRKLAERALGNG